MGKLNRVVLRCDGTIHGQLTDTGLEVKCKRRRCGYRKGVIVLHTFDLSTGKVVQTKIFAEPKRQKEGQHAADNASAAVRAS